MALVQDDLTKVMINATTKHPDGGNDAFIELGKATENYLCANTDAVYSWSGVLTVDPFTPDPTTSFNAEFVPSGIDFICQPKDFADFISKFAIFLRGIKIKAPSGFSLSPLENGVGIFKAKQIMVLEDETDIIKAMDLSFGLVAKGIIEGWQSYFQISSGGSHSAYAGSASLVSVN